MQRIAASLRSALAIAGLAVLAGCATKPAPIQDESLRSIAKEAYLYAYPMLYNYKTCLLYTSPSPRDS